MDGKRALLAIGMPLLSFLVARSLYSQEGMPSTAGAKPRLEIACEIANIPELGGLEITCSITASEDLTISRITMNDRDGCDFTGILGVGNKKPWPQASKPAILSPPKSTTTIVAAMLCACASTRSEELSSMRSSEPCLQFNIAAQ